MPPKGKAFTVELPQAIADEIADAARKSHRSTAFIVARALAAAWTATRARVAAWIAREVEAQKAEHADDLDAGLRDAADAKAAPARLVELARSEYVRVRTLVARHPEAPPEALQILGADKDRVVREALENRRLQRGA
ncbi:MAG: variant leucine-rich repeat-containing protein [Polyangia bacterium]